MTKHNSLTMVVSVAVPAMIAPFATTANVLDVTIVCIALILPIQWALCRLP